MEAVVIGCGVIGLTSAIRLQEAGFSTRIIARERAAETTSAAAGAIWYPYKVFPEELVLPWSRRTLDVLYELAAEPASGVRIAALLEIVGGERGDPWWKSAVRSFRRARPDELPPGSPGGYVAEVPLLETGSHLSYLTARFESGGGRIRIEPDGLEAPRDALGGGRLVVNCTGLGARSFVGDSAVYPIRGQLVRVTNPGLERCLLDERDSRVITYILPRWRDCIVGGTSEENEWDLTPDPTVTEAILDRARRLEPRLEEADVLEVRAGLRPARSSVRLEVERLAGGHLIHNYGHGGAGFTLCWGCAEEVVALATAVATGSTRPGSPDVSR